MNIKNRSQISDALYTVMTSQRFHDFYMSKSKKSLTAHIEGRDGCPDKEEIKTKILSVFDHVFEVQK